MTKLSGKAKQLKSVPTDFRICAENAGGIQLEAASGDGEAKLRRFTMTAYTGGEMVLAGFPHPVVVDLVGLKVPAKSRPILKDHNRSLIVGHTDTITMGENTLEVAGVISGAGPVAQEVIASSENGFPWQASVGARAEKVVFVPQGKTVSANGRQFTGPLYVARKATLGEVSFVALAADDNTSAQVAASAAQQETEIMTMNFEQWVEAQGFVLAELNEKQTSNLKAMYEASQEGEGDGKTTVATTTSVMGSENAVADLRAELAAETKRVGAIRKVCAGQHGEIEARAIEEGWEETKTELEVLRAERPAAPHIGRGRDPINADILEAAACMSAGLDENDLVKQYGDRAMEAANPMRHIGLRELVAACARMEGQDLPPVFGDGTATIRAGFSTMSLPGILENVMNKTMLAAYQVSEIVALQLCKVGSVSDFKEVTRYRLLGTGGFEQVAPDGELKHGKLGEQKFTNKADTYGQILMLTRRDIINDDLGAFMDIPREMGRSGAESIDDLFFSLFLSNPGSFFSAGNNNYLTGVDTDFGPDSLTTAKTLFRKQKAGPGAKAKDQKPINIRPENLIVPVELETEAELLMGSAQIMLDGASSKTKMPTDNPHRNKYKILSAPHLSDSYYTGNSAKAWYLFANPAVVPAFELVFLNGKRTPTIERIEAPANMLGMGFRGYIDVGVKEQDPRGAVKVKGEA